MSTVTLEDIAADLQALIEAGNLNPQVDLYIEEALRQGRTSGEVSRDVMRYAMRQVTEAITDITQNVLDILRASTWERRESPDGAPCFISRNTLIEASSLLRDGQVMPFPAVHSHKLGPRAYRIALRFHASKFTPIVNFGLIRPGVEAVVITVDPDAPTLNQVGLILPLLEPNNKPGRDGYSAFQLTRRGECVEYASFVTVGEQRALGASLYPWTAPFDVHVVGRRVPGQLGKQSRQLILGLPRLVKKLGQIPLAVPEV